MPTDSVIPHPPLAHRKRVPWKQIAIGIIALVILVLGALYATVRHAPLLSEGAQTVVSEEKMFAVVDSVPGTVTGVEEGGITLKAYAGVILPEDLKVVFDADTVFMVRGELKEESVYQAEFSEYQENYAKVREGDRSARPYFDTHGEPDPYTYTEVPSYDFKEGEYVVVLPLGTIGAGEDEITAKTVYIGGSGQVSGGLVSVAAKESIMAFLAPLGIKGSNLLARPPIETDPSDPGGPIWATEFSASPTTISPGGTTTLYWSSDGAGACTGTGFSTGGATYGSVVVSPGSSATYSIDCTLSGLHDRRTLTINVVAPPAARCTYSPPNSGGWSAYTENVTWDLGSGQYFSGLRLRSNCDFTSSADGCMAVRIDSVPAGNMFYTPVNGTWTAFQGNLMVELSGGQFISGIQWRANCDFSSSEDGCMSVRISSASANTSGYRTNTGYWTSPGGTSDGYSENANYDLGPGEYISGIDFRQNCDGVSSEDDCIRIKVSYYTVQDGLCGISDLVGNVGGVVSGVAGSNVTLAGSITNYGPGTTVTNVPNTIQVCNGDCSYNVFSAVDTGPIASGGTAGVSVVRTLPATPGSYIYRVCANINSSWTNYGVPESNYDNNCSGWQTLSVTDPNLVPIGYIDGVSGGTACVVSGWIVDQNTPSQSVRTHIYVNGGAGAGTFIGEVLGNQYRADLTGFGSGGYGYSLSIPSAYRDNVAHQIYAYGIDTQDGTGNHNSQLKFAYNDAYSPPLTFTCPPLLPDVTPSNANGPTSLIVGQTGTWSATTYNVGNVSTGVNVPVAFAIDNADHTVRLSEGPSTAGPIPAGGSAVTSFSYAFSSPGTYWIIPCSDVAPGWVGTFNESNEGNNCGAAWVAITVYAVPTSSFSLSPTSVAYGGSTTISWSSVAATSCTGTGFSTGGATSGSVAVSATVTTTYYLSCSGPGGTASTKNATLTVGAQPFPDLTPGAIPNVYVPFGQGVTVTGTVTNIGNAASGASFNNMFVTNLNAAGTAWNTTATAAPVTGNLAVNGSASFSYTFPANTFAAPGTYAYADCVDQNAAWAGLITESNEGNNCYGANIIVTIPDLTAVNGGNIVGKVGTASSLGGTVQNIGNGSSGVAVQNLVQVCDTNCATYNQYNAVNTSGAVAAGGSQGVAVTVTAPNTAGVYSYRLCANVNPSFSAYPITESNNANNCAAWNSFTVTAPDITATAGAAATVIQNQAITLSGTVTNGGNAAAGSFPSIVQVCNSAGCGTPNTIVAANTIASLASGGTAAVSASYTPTSMTQLSYRVCGNTNTSMAYPMLESNTGNNCSAWQSLAVTPPIPGTPTNATAVCNATGTLATLSWTAPANATFYYVRVTASTCPVGWQKPAWDTTICVPNPDSVTSTSITYVTTPGQAYPWWVHGANVSGYGTPANSSFTCSGAADLTAGSVTPTTATAGTPVTLSGTATNSGNAASGSFPMLFQVSQTGALVNSAYLAAIPAGSSRAGTASYTFPSAGTYQVRACANNNTSWVNIVTESDYGNDCGAWTDVVVGAAGSVSCTVSPASVPTGGSATYTATPANGAGSPYTWTAGDGGSYGSASTVTRTFATPGTYAMTVGASGAAATAACPFVAVATTWCTTSTPVFSITAAASRVKAGTTASLSWSASGINGQSATCTVTGPGVSWSSPVSDAPTCSVPNGSATPTIATQSTYTMTCGSQSKSVIVNVIPNIIEF